MRFRCCSPIPTRFVFGRWLARRTRNNTHWWFAPPAAVKAFDEKYLKEYKQRIDHNGMKGYSSVYIVKAMTEKIGKFDSKALAAALHGAKISAKDNPGVLLDVSFDQKGDLDRESFIVKVVGGKQQVIATVPPVGAK